MTHRSATPATARTNAACRHQPPRRVLSRRISQHASATRHLRRNAACDYVAQRNMTAAGGGDELRGRNGVAGDMRGGGERRKEEEEGE